MLKQKEKCTIYMNSKINRKKIIIKLIDHRKLIDKILVKV